MRQGESVCTNQIVLSVVTMPLIVFGLISGDGFWNGFPKVGSSATEEISLIVIAFPVSEFKEVIKAHAAEQ